jgi:hypothetical protein
LEELKYYAEFYRVGVLIVALGDESLDALMSGSIRELDSDEVEVYEIASAPYEHKQLKWQSKLFSALGISDNKSLWGWGEEWTLPCPGRFNDRQGRCLS